MKPRSKNWQKQAGEILLSYEKGISKGPITQKILSNLLGVSRQTIWRDKDTSWRIEQLQRSTTGIPATDSKEPRRANCQERIQALQESLRDLRRENGNLTQRIVEIYTKLAEAGLNPLDFIGHPVVAKAFLDNSQLVNNG